MFWRDAAVSYHIFRFDGLLTVMDVDLGYLWPCLASLTRKNTHLGRSHVISDARLKFETGRLASMYILRSLYIIGIYVTALS